MYNQLQNIFGKIKQSIKFKQDHKTLISAFAYFLRASAKDLFH